MTTLLLMCAWLAQASGGYVISGRTVDALTGRPLERVHLTVSLSGRAQAVQETVSGTGGEFRFAPIAAGKYSLDAQRNGYGPAGFGSHRLMAQYSSAVVVGPNDSGENLVFRMHPSAVITGRATDEYDEGVPDLAVYALRVTGEGEGRRAAMVGIAFTDDRGAYRLHTLPAGRYVVATAGQARMNGSQGRAAGEQLTYPTSFAPGVLDAAQGALYEVKEGGSVEANLRLRAQASVAVTGRMPATKDGQEQAVILTTPVFQGQLPARPSRVSADGQFQMTDVPPGRYRLIAVQGHQPVASREVNIDANHREISLVEPAAATVAVRMKILNPSGRLLVGLVNQNGLGLAVQPLDVNGEAQFGAMAAGAYTLVVRSGLGLGHEALAVQAEGASLQGKSILIPETGTVKVTATVDLSAAAAPGIAMRAGKPAAGLLVLLVSAAHPEDQSSYRLDQSDSDGSFTLNDVPPGEYLAFCFEEGDEMEVSTPNAVARVVERGQAVKIGADRREPFRVEVTRPAPEK